MPIKFLVASIVLAIVIAINFYLGNQSRSQSEVTDYLIELIEKRNPNFKIEKEADHEISFILDHITHRVTLQSFHNLLEETEPKTHPELFDRFADSCLATVALIREKGDDASKTGALTYEEVLTKLRAHWPKDEIITFTGKSVIKSPEQIAGAANYKTIAEIGGARKMRTEFLSYVQPVDRGGQTQADFTVTFDGETWIRAEESSGWIGKKTVPKNEAWIGPTRRLSDFYHENGLSAFLSYWRLFGMIPFEKVINDPAAFSGYSVNIKVDQLAENRVKVTFSSGIVGFGFSRDVLIFDPTQNWAFISGDQELGVSKAGVGLAFYVHCSNFKPFGGQHSYYFPQTIVTGFPSDLETTHELTSFAIMPEAAERTFTLTLGEKWKINWE